MKSIFSSISHGYRWVVQPLLVFAVLIVGFVGAKWLTSKQTVTPHLEERTYAPLVRVLTTDPVETQVRIHATGALAARTRVNLVAQVGGRVVAIHPGFRSGGSFDKDEVLVRIEPKDYELAVARAQAEVSASQTALQTLQAESEAALEEWRLLNGDQPTPTLVAKEPQLQAAQARIDAAQAALEGARLDLRRTDLRLPWAGRILTTLVDVGSVVTPGQTLAAAYSTEVFEVSVPLRQDQLRWVHLPGERMPIGSGPDGREPITVTVQWPGASVGSLETLALEPLERAIRAVEEFARCAPKPGRDSLRSPSTPPGSLTARPCTVASKRPCKP